jgi:hypothetical protein
MALDLEALITTEDENKRRGHRRPLVVRDARLKSLGYAQKVLANGVDVPITTLNFGPGVGLPQGVTIILINVEGGPIRYRDDGGQCDAATGELWPQGSIFARTLMIPTAVHVAGVGAASVVNFSAYGI